METIKRCSRCQIEKPLEQFNRNRAIEDGLQKQCRPCQNEANRRYKAKHRDRVREARTEYYQRNLERLRVYHRERARRDRAVDPESQRAASRRWKAKNRQHLAEYQQRREALKRSVTAEPVDYAYIVERDGSRCHLCGRKVARREMHFDHLIPLSRGGTHTVDNIRVSHGRCNMSRGADRAPAQLLLVA